MRIILRGGPEKDHRIVRELQGERLRLGEARGKNEIEAADAQQEPITVSMPMTRQALTMAAANVARKGRRRRSGTGRSIPV